MADVFPHRSSRTQGRYLAVLVRRQYVFALRATGATYETIFQAARRHFGLALPRSYDRRQVHKDVMDEFRKRRAELADTVETVRALELARLDQLQLAVWQRAMGTPPDIERGLPAVAPDLEAGQQILRIMQQRMRLLPGLAAPQASAPTTPNGKAPYDPQTPVTEAFCIEVASLLAQFGGLHTNGHTPLTPDDTRWHV
jgi:hypothetical protein